MNQTHPIKGYYTRPFSNGFKLHYRLAGAHLLPAPILQHIYQSPSLHNIVEGVIPPLARASPDLTPPEYIPLPTGTPGAPVPDRILTHHLLDNLSPEQALHQRQRDYQINQESSRYGFQRGVPIPEISNSIGTGVGASLAVGPLLGRPPVAVGTGIYARGPGTMGGIWRSGVGKYGIQEIGYGTGKSDRPLVLIGGLAMVGTVDFWPLAERLGDERPVLVFDNRNMGESIDPDEWDHFSIQDLAIDAAELIKHLGFREVDILGFAMGGMIAQTLATTPGLPFVIRHLILASTSAKNPHSDLGAFLSPPPRPLYEMSESERMEYARPWFEALYSPKWLADPENSELFKRRLLDSINYRRPERTVLAQSRAIERYDVCKRLPFIPRQIPVLVIHGRLDRAVYFSERKYILEGIKHAEIARTPQDDFGHQWFDYFSVSYWCNELSQFLDRHLSLQDHLYVNQHHPVYSQHIHAPLSPTLSNLGSPYVSSPYLGRPLSPVAPHFAAPIPPVRPGLGLIADAGFNTGVGIGSHSYSAGGGIGIGIERQGGWGLRGDSRL